MTGEALWLVMLIQRFQQNTTEFSHDDHNKKLVAETVAEQTQSPAHSGSQMERARGPPGKPRNARILIQSPLGAAWDFSFLTRSRTCANAFIANLTDCKTDFMIRPKVRNQNLWIELVLN